MISDDRIPCDRNRERQTQGLRIVHWVKTMQAGASKQLYVPGPGLNRLKILELVAVNCRITQTMLARHCNLSVAMVNNYMKDLCTAGLLQYRRRNKRSVSYHLTSLGKERIEEMRQEFLLETSDLVTQMKEFINSVIRRQTAGSLRRVVLYGGGNLAELTFHALGSAAVNVIAVCDDDPTMLGLEWCGREPVSPFQIRFMAPDAVIITDLHRAGEISRALSYLIDRGIRIIRLDGKTGEPISQVADPGENLNESYGSSAVRDDCDGTSDL
jgi:predicted transcriptional regulator